MFFWFDFFGFKMFFWFSIYTRLRTVVTCTNRNVCNNIGLLLTNKLKQATKNSKGFKKTKFQPVRGKNVIMKQKLRDKNKFNLIIG